MQPPTFNTPCAEMISNIPEYQELRSIAIRAYFVAWKEATSIFDWIEHSGVIAFDIENETLVPIANEEDSLTKEESENNISKYEAAMQHKLRLIYSLIQHSQELALKSYICEVSPFLLLAGSDVKGWAKQNTDFMECKTLDASDLVRVVTAIGAIELSENFKRIIEEVRIGRNSIQHMGKHKHIDILEPIRILTVQYIEMYRGRNWIQDLHKIEDDGLSEIFYQDTTMDNVMLQLSMLHRLTSRRMAKRVLGMQEESTVYECLDCLSMCEYFDNSNMARSIERKRGSMEGHCFLCNTTFKLRKKKCKKCGCDVVFGSGDHQGVCCSCGR